MMLAGNMQIKFEGGKAEGLLMLKGFEYCLRSSRGKKELKVYYRFPSRNHTSVGNLVWVSFLVTFLEQLN